MLGRLFRRATTPTTAREAGRALGQIARDDAKARKRAMVDQIRADLRAKGRTDMEPIDWSTL
ncbi:hypothetical protein EDF56_101168 [Novosphingobium sp. PhB165]|uniref:hypothetical protein n=1 Tax=Novosphingobium sp. PhB165 TaxID=2485105 RepID=UPI001042B2C5|nr:hypothetical protein [Novosphingobium sp. PhB165]TCM21504.1 hypothetical protein EDF56_101168 [Novosphingobium sp. PhB165]